MVEKKVKLLKHYFGVSFLNYILDIESVDDQKNDIEFNKKQKEVLTDLYNKFKIAQKIFIQEDYIEQTALDSPVRIFKDIFLKEEPELFNKYKECISNKELVKFSSEDKLLEYISNICIREYPNLLINSSDKYFERNLSLNIEWNDIYPNLIKEDILHQLTNKKEGGEYYFSFERVNGGNVYISVILSLENLIKRALRNCVYKKDYSLEKLLKEVKMLLFYLRSLAQDNKIEYSCFTGLSGLEIEEGIQNPIELDDKSKLYFGKHKFNNKITGDCTLETTCNLKILKIIPEIPKIIDMNQKEECDRQDKILQALKLSLSFVLLEDRGIGTLIFETGFPLVFTGNSSIPDKKLRKNIKITEKNLINQIRRKR